MYNIVIGNPPYGIKIEKTETTFYQSNYATNDDIYSRFFEMGLNVLKQGGALNFITPIFWLNGDNYLATRKMIASNSSIDLAIVLPYDIFQDAYVDTGIFQLIKGEKNIEARVHEFDIKDKIEFNRLVNTKYHKLNPIDWQINSDLAIVLNPFWRSLKSKIFLDRTLDNLSKSFRGILADKKDYSEIKYTDDFAPVFTGSFNRYESPFDEYQFVNYQNIKEGPKDIHLFKGNKILVRRLINRQLRVMATISNSFMVFKKDVYIFKMHDINLTEVVAAILNSKLISFLLTKGSASARKDDFTQVTLSDIRKIGIPRINENESASLKLLVNRLLETENQSPTTDNEDLENQIDQLVYQLYGLTEEEIEIIESSVK